MSPSFNLSSEHLVCIDTKKTRGIRHCIIYVYVSYSLYELNPIRKRSIRFVQDIGVGLFDEQIKHEDRRRIDDKARKKNILINVNRNKNGGLDKRKMHRLIKKKSLESQYSYRDIS